MEYTWEERKRTSFGTNRSERYRRNVIKILSVVTLVCMVIYYVVYYDFVLHVSASFGHHQVYLNTKKSIRRKDNYKYKI
jgi:predicted membrane protein